MIYFQEYVGFFGEEGSRDGVFWWEGWRNIAVDLVGGVSLARRMRSAIVGSVRFRYHLGVADHDNGDLTWR